MRDRSSNERGIVLLITTAVMAVVILTVGLAVDASYLYTVKAKLSSSCDAAALAAARSLNVGLTLAAQEASARARARAFFDANFPDGLFNTRDRTLEIQIAETAYRTRTVLVQAAVTAPTYFMRLTGHNSVQVAAEGMASRRDVNLIVVLDRSGSMANSGACAPMKEAARSFVSHFAEGRDRLGLISFSGAWNLSFPPSKQFKTSSPTMDEIIDGINCVGGTNSATGLSEAYNQLAAIDEPGTLNLILFFTDGNPTALSARFKVRKYSDVYPKSTCYDIYGHSNTYPSWVQHVQDRVGVLIGLGNRPNDYPTAKPYGLYNIQVDSPNAQDVTIDGPVDSLTSRRGCAFGPGTRNVNRAYRDVAYVPGHDYYGNRTGCCYYRHLRKFSGGAYNGKIRSDRSDTVIEAATNALDNAAKRMRQDQRISPVIFTIGLGQQVDETLLKRVANDPSSPTYNDVEPTGMYVYAPDKTQLNQAFARVASEILRLAR